MKHKKKYNVSSTPMRFSKPSKLKKETKDELILLAHSISVEGLSKAMAVEKIAIYKNSLNDSMLRIEKKICGYKIHNFIVTTPVDENQGIKLLYPQLKEEIDNRLRTGEHVTEKTLDRLTKVYDILKGK